MCIKYVLKNAKTVIKQAQNHKVLQVQLIHCLDLYHRVLQVQLIQCLDLYHRVLHSEI